MPKNVWNEADAPKSDGLESLMYRSRLLGSDRTLVNIFGGNTSTKSLEKDHLGREVTVLWVKGSGSDIASIGERGFAGLKLEEVLPLFDRSSMTDEEMTGYLDRTAFEVGRPRQSIETLLHAFVPAKHVDHTHPDAIISIACSGNGQEIMTEIYGERAAWVEYIRQRDHRRYRPHRPSRIPQRPPLSCMAGMITTFWRDLGAFARFTARDLRFDGW